MPMIDGGFIYGHPIGWDGAVWRYADSGEPIAKEDRRSCPKCGLPPTADGHDPCIANLPGVSFACCGHGVMDGYVKFDDGRVIRGVFKVEPAEA